jgi:hypothetical protein
MYAFLLNMWIMRKVDEAYLQSKVTSGRISQEEYNMITATPRIPA